MYLLTDKQTLADLDIRNDSSYGGWELCSLFGKTHTKEGKRMVREWISQPLSDYTLIQERIEAIRSESIPVLDMDEEELEEMGQKAKQRIKDEYSWQYICDKYTKVWEKN